MNEGQKTSLFLKVGIFSKPLNFSGNRSLFWILGHHETFWESEVICMESKDISSKYV